MPRLDEVGVDVVPRRIGLALDLHRFAGQRLVAVNERLDGLAHHRHGELGDGGELFPGQLERERAELEHLARDALGIITDPFEFLDHLAG